MHTYFELYAYLLNCNTGQTVHYVNVFPFIGISGQDKCVNCLPQYGHNNRVMCF